MEHLNQEEQGRMRVLRQVQDEHQSGGHMNFEENSIFADAVSKPDRSFKRRWLRIKPRILGFFFKLPMQFIYALISILILKWFGFNF